ncbi:MULTISPECIES: ROK family protein [unclassified Salipiger]|uniref:ROK family protein n=1 Tax=unclassified Salipiger TaxID=2640570 RepID=UPI0013B6EACF|nr:MULTISPECIES: ROK family protein [unclassified Salipiger]NDV53781.1 ROK family protein [Salipiger sp. PrR003]NDW35698.1 ROK family protein [Salipiger sp. PrR007]
MIVCFDIGGTSVKSAVATSIHDVRALSRRPTPGDDFDAFVATLSEAIAEAAGRAERVAISIAGVVDPKTGRATVANIPCLTGRRLAPELTALLGVEVLVANDADCFALAEAAVGAGSGHDVVFGAIIGTGVGGGLVAGGRLIGAGSGYAGEWGHGPVAKRLLDCLDTPLPSYQCGCGLNGCLDATCSARGIERLHRDIAGTELPSTEILARWHAGDAGASKTVAAWLELLSGPLAMVVNMTGATVVAAGGGLANDAALIAALDEATRPLTLAKPSEPLVVQAQCRTEPGLVGAAILALRAPSRDAA